MLEHTTGFKVISSFILKPIMAAVLALGWWPATDYVLLQIHDYAFINPQLMMWLNEMKVVLGIIISIAVLIKVIMGIVKLGKKEK